LYSRIPHNADINEDSHVMRDVMLQARQAVSLFYCWWK